MARSARPPSQEEMPQLRQASELEVRRKVNTQTKHFDPTTERFTFISFAKRLQQQLRQSVSPLHSTHVLDLLEQQHLLLRQSAGCAGVRPRPTEAPVAGRGPQDCRSTDGTGYVCVRQAV